MKYPACKKITRDILAEDGGQCVGGYVKNGVIYPALSPVKVADGCPQNVSFALYSPKIKRICALADGKLYLAAQNFAFGDGTEFAALNPFSFFSKEGDAVIAGDGECLSTVYALAEKTPLSVSVHGGVQKSGRVFAIDGDDPFIIRWSGKEGGLDWEEDIDGAGWVRLSPERGKILNLAIFKQKIAVVCEYGLALLNAFGTPENFKVQYIDGATAKIYQNTAQVAGDKLAFLTAEGLRLFNGASVENPRLGIEEDIQNPVFSLAADGNYFLCADSKSLKRRVIFTVDFLNSCGYIVDLPATAAYLNGGVFCFAEGSLYELRAGGAFTFTSGSTDFGVRGKKLLVSVFAGNEEPADIEVMAGGKSRIVRGVTGYCLPRMGGSTFKIRVVSKGKIHGLTAVAEVIDGI